MLRKGGEVQAPCGKPEGTCPVHLPAGGLCPIHTPPLQRAFNDPQEARPVGAGDPAETALQELVIWRRQWGSHGARADGQVSQCLLSPAHVV